MSRLSSATRTSARTAVAHLGVVCLEIQCGSDTTIGMLIEEEDYSQWPIDADVPPETQVRGSSSLAMVEMLAAEVAEAGVRAAEARVAELLAADIAKASARAVEVRVAARRAELAQEREWNSVVTDNVEDDDEGPEDVSIERTVLTLLASGREGNVPNLDSSKGPRVARGKLDEMHIRTRRLE